MFFILFSKLYISVCMQVVNLLSLIFFKDVHVFVVDNYFFLRGGGVLLNFIECLFKEIL